MENKMYHETFVHSQLSAQKLFERRLMILACIILPILGIFFGMQSSKGILLILATVIADIIIVYYLPNPHIDYEYVFVDGQIDFDRIIAGNNRKTMCKTDMEKVELVAQAGAEELNTYDQLPERDYSSEKAEDTHYIMITKAEKGNVRIRFTPDEEMILAMQQKAYSKVHQSDI